MSDSLQPHGLQHARVPCPSSTLGLYSNSCPLSWWCHPTISSSVIPFSSCPQSFPASRSFLMSRLFVSGGKSIGASASASVLLMNIQDWFPLGLTGLIFLLSKGLACFVYVCRSFCSKEQMSFNFTLQSPLILEPKKIVSHCFHCFPIYSPLSDWIGCHDLSFLNDKPR